MATNKRALVERMESSARHTHPHFQQPHRFFRGILIGILPALFLWGGIALVVWIVWLAFSAQ